MHFSYQALVLAALSLDCALAHPTHQQLHKHRRDLADLLHQKRTDFSDPALYAPGTFQNLDWASICAGGKCDPNSQSSSSPAPANPAPANPAPASSAPASSPEAGAGSAGGSTTPSTPASSPPASTGSASSSGSGSGSGSGSVSGTCNDLSSVWTKGDTSRSSAVYMGDGSQCPGGCTSADSPKYSIFGAATSSANSGDEYRGNVGEPYGQNLLPLSDCNTDGQDYSITFTANSPVTIALWNKVGDDWQTPGRTMTGASRNAWFLFDLAANDKAVIGVAPNSQVSFSQVCDRNENGQFDCPWGEADFSDTNNGAWSGYDYSVEANNYVNSGGISVTVDGFDVSDASACGFYKPGQEDTGCNTNPPAGSMHVKVSVG
ncbi:MAG: hypothetical protein ALECFALPRED_006040 [Alectoria fallacina]|uniref:Uncharacterized protein n=1 Tax=Alectoria fallacina TaxID=1903189 RepID=A0A8H3IVT2_9LECA|nr:MAG: hypothetical protein ALECFALPRED_006040 [Alectoria fallacina]